MKRTIEYHTKLELNNIQPKIKKNRDGFVNLSSNELNLNITNNINQKILDTFKINEISKYPYPQHIINSYSNDLGIPNDMITFSAGSDDAIKVILTALSNKQNKNLIINYPEYEGYMNYGCLSELNIIKVPIKQTNNVFSADIDKLKSLLISIEPAIVAISNPNGFSGQSISFEDIKMIARICDKYNHILIVDETYSSFCQIDHINLIYELDNVIIIRSFSKSMGLAGLRLAVILSNQEMISYISKWNMINNVNNFTIHSFIEYLKLNPLPAIQSEIRKTKNIIIDKVNTTLEKEVIVDTNTNFLLIRTENSDISNEIEEKLYLNKYIVKNLNTLENFTGYLRFTVGEKNIMNKFSELLIKLFKEHDY